MSRSRIRRCPLTIVRAAIGRFREEWPVALGVILLFGFYVLSAVLIGNMFQGGG